VPKMGRKGEDKLII